MAAKDRNLVIVLLGVLVLVGCYFFVYRTMTAENETLTSENQALSSKLTQLKGMIEQESFYESEITRIENEIKQELTAFPSGLQYENGIMDVVELEHFANAQIPSLTVGTPTVVSVGGSAAEGTDADATASSAAANQYSLYEVTTNIVYSASYADTKNLVNLIAEDDNKRCMRSFTATYDATTGLLSGAIEYESYYIDGQDDKSYEQADIPAISHGVDNIFGTIEYSTPAEVEEVINEATE